MTETTAPTISSDDKLTKNRSIYDATPGEIFWRNFLAGVSRAIGSIIIYLIFLAIMSAIFATFILPQIQPLLSTYTKSMELLQNFGGTPSNSQSPTNQPVIDQNQLQILLNQYQQPR